MMRLRSSRNSFLDHFGGPKEAKINQKSSSDDVQMMLRMRKVKMLIFDTPPIKDQCFWVPMEVKMEVKWSLKSIFIAIENDDEKVMLYREGVES